MNHWPSLRSAVAALSAALGACSSTTPPRDGGADAGLDVASRRDSSSADVRTGSDVEAADAYFVRDVASPDAISSDAPFGDAPASGGDGSECASPRSLCGGECVDEQTDPNHCGGCGVACAGSCLSARCLLTIASNQDHPTGIAVNGTYIYWTNQGTGALTNGSVVSAPAAGISDGGPPTVLAAGQGSPDGIVLDENRVYWTTELTGTLMSLPASAASGGVATPVTLVSGQRDPAGLAVDPARLYWTNAGGGADGGTVMSLSLGDAGAAAPATLASGQAAPVAIAVNDAGVFWTDEGAVVALPFADAAAPVVLVATTPSAIAIDGTSVYWTRLGTAANGYTDGSVLRLVRATGVVTTLATGQSVGVAIAVDGTSAYWTTRQMTGGGGNIVKVAITGGSPTTLLAGQAPRGGLAVDATSVYWASDNEGGSVLKLTPK